jgi:hypothetical protein
VPAVFDKLGIRFHYPENWKLDEESAHQGPTSVTVISPGGAFWTLSLHPVSADLPRLTRAVLEALREEYKELDAEPIEEVVCDHELVGYDVNFYWLDLTNTALVRAFRTPRATCVLLCQAEDREFVQVERVFLAMTTSLLRESR